MISQSKATTGLKVAILSVLQTVSKQTINTLIDSLHNRKLTVINRNGELLQFLITYYATGRNVSAIQNFKSMKTINSCTLFSEHSTETLCTYIKQIFD